MTPRRSSGNGKFNPLLSKQIHVAPDLPQDVDSVNVGSGGKGPEQSMLFAVQPGSEIDAVGVGIGAAVARHEGPQAVDLDGFTVSPIQLAKVLVGMRVEYINGAVAEIPDKEVIAEFAEAGWRDRESPGRIEVATRRDSGSTNCPSMLNSST
jgi:hypothetical protein